MNKIRKKYGPEEKAKIALEAIKGELTQSQITSKYGPHSTQINNWKKKLKAGIVDIFRSESPRAYARGIICFALRASSFAGGATSTSLRR